MYKKIVQEIERLQMLKKEAENIIRNSPEGNLRCAINKGCFQYYSGKSIWERIKRNI